MKFVVDTEGLVLEYETEQGDGQWVQRDLDRDGEAMVSRAFTFEPNDLIDKSAEDDVTGGVEYRFRFATLDNGYFDIPGRIFGIANRLLFAADAGFKFERRMFVAERHVSVLRRISAVVGADGDIVIGGDRPDAIPASTYLTLLKLFPNTTELNRYANTRVATIVGDYFGGMKDWKAQYDSYLNTRASVKTTDIPVMSALWQSEIQKYAYIRDTIAMWLRSASVRSEKDWQLMILEFILLIFPKYVAVLQNVHIDDYYSRPGSVTARYLDIALVDANGNIDVVEIKRPSDDALLSKAPYRSNWVPTKELSGTIMQAEKYLFHLSKWGAAGERKLSKKRGHELPPGMSLKITNPKALVILGRDRRPDGTDAFEPGQTFDLEVIKRKYANMMDIVTYDDLLRRLDNTIAALERRLTSPISVTSTV